MSSPPAAHARTEEMAVVHRVFRRGLSMVAERFDRVRSLLGGRRVSATGVEPRAEAVAEYTAGLVEPLDDEEAHVVPPNRAHITAPDWERFGQPTFEKCTDAEELTATGPLEEVATAEKASWFTVGLSARTRMTWRLAGRRYTHYTARVRGDTDPSALLRGLLRIAHRLAVSLHRRTGGRHGGSAKGPTQQHDRLGTLRGGAMADATRVSRGGGRVDVAVAVCVVCGVVGAVLAGYLAGASGTLGVYPHPVPGSAALQIVLALCRIGLLLGLLSLRSSGVMPASRGARTAHYAAVAVLAGLTVAEGIAISVPMSASDATPRAFAVVYAVYTALLGIALLVLGVEVARRGSWQGPGRWLTAVLGLWLLVAVLPALAFAPASAGWAVAAWMLLFAMLGLAQVRRPRQPPIERAAFPARAYAMVTWVYVAGFGSSSVPVAASLLESGRLPSFFGVFRMFGGPWSVAASPRTLLVLVTAFLVLTVIAAWAAWLVQHGSRAGTVLAAVLLPAEALFWYGLSLPIPWLLGIARLLLLVAGWRTVDARRATLGADRRAGRLSQRGV